MTYNSEIFHRTSAEVNTQIASYFDIVDNSVQMADTNKRYTINPQSCYAPGPPVSVRSFTTVIISPNSDNTADIYNGFIKAKMKVKFNIDSALTNKFENEGVNFNKLWFGFKDSMDVIEKYEILANGVVIYTQNFAPEESFITASGNNEVVKRADVYSKVRHKDIWGLKYGSKCGCVVELNNTDTTYPPGANNFYDINLKIDLRRFLPLSNIKYLPAFAGKIELRLYFGTSAMVYCPVGVVHTLQHDVKTLSGLTIPEVTNEFTQIGDEITTYVSYDKTTKILTAGKRTCNADQDCFISECYSIVPCFGIDNNIYQSLVQRYMTQALTFPTQTIAVFPMSNQLKGQNSSSTQTITPRFVDSIFVLFPLKSSHHTVFKNPLFKSFQIRCGGYGSVPAIPFATDGTDPAFIEYCENAMNLNGESSGFNKEVIQSLINSAKFGASKGNHSDDRTSFFVALPTETDNTFQQGQTSNTPITYEIKTTQEDAADDYAGANPTSPKMCLLVDSTFSIQVQPNGMPPVVDMGAYDITSPVAQQ